MERHNLSKCPSEEKSGKRQGGGEHVNDNSSPLKNDQPVSGSHCGDAVYAGCLVNGVKVDALIDTGAQVTLLNKKIFDKIQPQPSLKRTSVSVSGACTGSELRVVGVAKLNLTLGNINILWPVYVCENINIPMLLGEDFLRDNGILIDFSNDRLLVKRKTIDLKYKPNLEVCRVSFSSHTNICAKSVTNVSCKVAGGLMKEGTNGIVKPAEQFETKYGLGVICVVGTIRNGEIPVRIINPRDSDVVIWKGSSVGQLYPLLPEENMNDTSIPSHCYFVHVDSQTFVRTVNRSTDSQVSDRKDVPGMFPIDNPDIPESEKNLIYGILKQHEKVISQGPNDLGSVSSIKHKINTGMLNLERHQ